MNTVLLGATRGMGQALSRHLVESGHNVFLLGRSSDALERSVADLKARRPLDENGVQQKDGDRNSDNADSNNVVDAAVCDLSDPKTFEPALAAAEKALGRIETVVVTAGQFGTQDDLEANPERAMAVLQTNFTYTILFCEAARKKLLAQPQVGRANGQHQQDDPPGPRLVVFSSVAGDRGRKPVVLYGASKAGLSAYLEGLDHKYSSEGLQVITVKPGFVKTGMTEGLKPPPFAGEPMAVAKTVLQGIEKGSAVIYAPPVWRWIMMVIRCLPRAVMRRLGF